MQTFNWKLICNLFRFNFFCYSCFVIVIVIISSDIFNDLDLFFFLPAPVLPHLWLLVIFRVISSTGIFFSPKCYFRQRKTIKDTNITHRDCCRPCCCPAWPTGRWCTCRCPAGTWHSRALLAWGKTNANITLRKEKEKDTNKYRIHLLCVTLLLWPLARSLSKSTRTKYQVTCMYHMLTKDE